MAEKEWQSPIDGIVCVQLKTKIWPGAVKLEAQDIGVDPDDIPDDLIKLGNKRLYPKEQRQRFAKITGRGAQYLLKYSLPFVVNTVRMVPRMQLPKILDKFEEVQQELKAEVVKFLSEYQGIKEDWLDEHSDFRKALEPHYPDAEKLRKKFGFDWVVFEIRGIRAQEVDDLALKDTIKEAQQEFNRQAEEMVQECVTLLRTKVSQVVSNLSNRLKEGKIVRNDTLESVKNIHEMFEEMNVWGDTEISRSLAKLKQAVDNIGDAAFLKNNKELTNELVRLADDVSAAATNLEDVSSMSGRFKRFIDIEAEDEG